MSSQFDSNDVLERLEAARATTFLINTIGEVVADMDKTQSITTSEQFLHHLKTRLAEHLASPVILQESGLDSQKASEILKRLFDTLVDTVSYWKNLPLRS